MKPKENFNLPITRTVAQNRKYFKKKFRLEGKADGISLPADPQEI